MGGKSEKTDFESAALVSLRAVAQDVSCSATARVAAAKAILEHLRPAPPAPKQRGAARASGAPVKTPSELADELAELRRKRAIQALK